MTKYLRVPADLEKPMEEVDLTGLDALQAGIGGGWIEGVNLPRTPRCPGARFYCDEEFQFKQELGVNLRASLMGHAAGVMHSPDAIIGGDVLLFDGYTDAGDDKPVTGPTVLWARTIEDHIKAVMQKGEVQA